MKKVKRANNIEFRNQNFKTIPTKIPQEAQTSQ